MSKRPLRPATALFPVPTVMVSCGDEKPNIITIAWAGILCSDPPTLSVAVRPGRHSHGLISASREYVVNIPSQKLLKIVDYCGVVSGRDVDKFAATGLTPLPASEVKAPLIAECPVNIECKVISVVSLGSHDLFIGQVVAVHADEEVLDALGQIDVGKAQPFAYAHQQYWSLGEHLETHGFSVRKIQV
ncbi:MAG: flavin reductase family protein [Dehalococcoidia bacterium]|nr:flavin reductase family protein [Dehalococcoidia bacterium]